MHVLLTTLSKTLDIHKAKVQTEPKTYEESGIKICKAWMCSIFRLLQSLVRRDKDQT